ncbi:MAG: tRNA (adenosine(37)-N6)-threonylcarbamoyltransferase complex dimerization subunit type 1 TsaB, partial [Nitrospirae bacterium]
MNPGTTLSIDTVSPVGGASLYSAREGLLCEMRFRGGRLHSARLMEAIDSLFNITGLKPDSIDFITVSAGPGSFTGLRVGMSTAKGFCYALGIPMVLVSSLEAMAVSAGAFRGLIVPVFDARKKEVYAAVFSSAGGQPERVIDDAPM